MSVPSERGLGETENGRGRVDMDEMSSDRTQPTTGGSGTVQLSIKRGRYSRSGSPECSIRDNVTDS